MEKIGFGGSCHWCTEAIFQSLKDVSHVEQGWIASTGDASDFSEAVIVAFDPEVISLDTLISVHLHSHSCTSNHKLRSKYRSAIYTFGDQQAEQAHAAIKTLQSDFQQLIVTVILPFRKFKLNHKNFLYYYYSDPQKPFCENIVTPKLKALRTRFGAIVIEQ